MWPFRFAMHRKRGLRMMVVSLLSTSPKNGVEIMDGIEAMTRGWWRPSPGSIYPLLERMSGEGTIKKRADGKYELTPKANAELEVSFGPNFRRPRTLEEVIGEVHSFVSYLEDLNASGKSDLSPHLVRVRELGERLVNLAKSEGSAGETQTQE